MTSKQWSDWIAYYRVEPFGHDVGFELLAMLCAILSNVYRKKGAKALKVSDFYNRMTLSRRAQSPEEMKAIFTQLAQEVNRQEKKKMPKGRVRDKKHG